MPIPVSLIVATMVFVFACWVTDVKTRQIPNRLSLSAFIVGVALNVMFWGQVGLLYSLAGAIAAGCVLVAPFALGGIGGGDLKMMSAVGALVGPLMVLHALVVGFLLGGVIMLLHLARLGRLHEKLASTARMVTGAWSGKSLAPLRLSDSDVTAVTLPYSVPLGLGTVAVIIPWMRLLTPLP